MRRRFPGLHSPALFIQDFGNEAGLARAIRLLPQSPASAYTLLISSALHNETDYTLHCLSLIIGSAVRSKAQMFVYQERSIATNAIPP